MYQLDRPTSPEPKKVLLRPNCHAIATPSCLTAPAARQGAVDGLYSISKPLTRYLPPQLLCWRQQAILYTEWLWHQHHSSNSLIPLQTCLSRLLQQTAVHCLHCSRLSTQVKHALQLVLCAVLCRPALQGLRVWHHYCHWLLLQAVASHKDLQDKRAPAKQRGTAAAAQHKQQEPVT